MRLPLTLVAISATLAACAPALPPVSEARLVPEIWSQGALRAEAGVDDRWWTTFGDARIDRLVALAEASDDIAIARARLAEADSRTLRARALLRPEARASIGAETQRVDDLEQSQTDGLASLVWAPDLNGAAGARARAADAAFVAETARLAAVRQATRASAVRLYVLWAEAEARLAAAEAGVAALEETLEVAEARAAAGLTSGLDPAAARAELARARVRPPAALQAAQEARLGLEALLGLASGALADQSPALPLTARAPGAAPPLTVLAGRPDIVAAEAELLGAGFEAEAARRDFWPNVSLSAALGGRWVEPETPFSVTAGLGTLGASIAAPLFSFGRLEAARDGADARRELAALTYRRTATLALAEVETALSALAGAGSRVEMLELALVAARDRQALASQRHRAGLTSSLDVLVADLGVSEVQAELAGARADAARAWIALCVAQGLGTAEGLQVEPTGSQAALSGVR
ncbi:TolC family protein [Brevundimonas sp.]|uniref:TolC family protein n=1 Tax=Brevundimonas sp. TaxID=1871086 RepID=UPI00260D38D4|nr:TolC family protein [Brevundimonas sp.]